MCWLGLLNTKAPGRKGRDAKSVLALFQRCQHHESCKTWARQRCEGVLWRAARGGCEESGDSQQLDGRQGAQAGGVQGALPPAALPHLPRIRRRRREPLFFPFTASYTQHTFAVSASTDAPLPMPRLLQPCLHGLFSQSAQHLHDSSGCPSSICSMTARRFSPQTRKVGSRQVGRS